MISAIIITVFTIAFAMIVSAHRDYLAQGKSEEERELEKRLNALRIRRNGR